MNIYKQFGEFDLSGSLSSHFLNINQYKKHYFEKSFRVKYSPKSDTNTEIGLEYNSKYSTTNIRLLQYNPLYTKDLSFFQNTILIPDLLSNINKNFGTFSIVENTIGQSKDRYISVLSSDNRLSKSLSLKSKFSGSIFKDLNFIDGNNNITSIYSFELSQKIIY